MYQNWEIFIKLPRRWFFLDKIKKLTIVLFIILPVIRLIRGRSHFSPYRSHLCIPRAVQSPGHYLLSHREKTNTLKMKYTKRILLNPEVQVFKIKLKKSAFQPLQLYVNDMLLAGNTGASGRNIQRVFAQLDFEQYSTNP